MEIWFEDLGNLDFAIICSNSYCAVNNVIKKVKL